MFGQAGRASTAEAGNLASLSDPARELVRRLATGESIGSVLGFLVASIEARTDGLIASILILEHGRLVYGAAPGLPEGYNRAADNHPIGEGYGSCGTAAFRREPVIVSDTASDPLWKNYREITRRYRLAACWSMPIFDQAREVMGTFALYYHEPRQPRPDELALVRDFAELAAVALDKRRMQRSLAERARQLDELVDDVEAVIWEAPPDLARTSYVSPRAERMFGYPLARWYDEPGFWQSIIHPEDREACVRRHLETSAQDNRYELEYRLLGAGGKPVWVRESVRVERDAGGRPLRLRGTMVNVSRQREAEADRESLVQHGSARPAPAVLAPPAAITLEDPGTAEARRRRLADAASSLGTSLDVDETARNVAALAARELCDACLVFTRADPEGPIRGSAISCAALAHRDPGNAVTAAAFNRLLPQPGGVPFGLLALLAGGGVQRFESLGADSFGPGAGRLELSRLCRELGVQAAVALPMEVQTRRLGALVCLYASPGARDPAELEAADLVARRAALALENARLYHEAQAAIAQREEFLSVAAHELKTPLASLQLTIQSLHMGLENAGAGGNVDLDFLRGRVQAGERQTQRLGRLIHDLLDVAVMEAGRLRLDLEPTDLVVAVEAVRARLQDDIARKHVDVTIHAVTPVLGRWDSLRLDQVITNLLSNALKYGEGKPILVTVAGDDELACLEVTDHGLGMSNELVGRLFLPFERGVSAGHYGGLGLGLYITAQIVRAHGGTISVRSVPGGGSSFRVELPRRVR